MKRFIKYTFVFAAMVALTLIAGECIISSRPNSYKYKHRWMMENSSDVEVLILGSSHGYYGLQPSALHARAFNLANHSQNFEYDYLLLQLYAPLLRNLNTVILPLSYCSLFDTRFEECADWWYAINYKKYMDIDVHSDFSKYNFEFCNLPVYSGRLIKVLSGGELPMCDSLGFGVGYTIPARSATWKEDAQMTVDRHTAANWDAFDYNAGFLRKIAEFCNERSINLVVVTLPAWHLYYNRLDDAQVEKMYQTVNAMQREYGFRYLDYLRDGRFVGDDFYDVDHLSDVGALKFSSILKEDLGF